MNRKVFLSYVFEDHGYRDQVVDWAKRGQLGPIEIVMECDDVRRGGEAAIRAHLRPILRQADALLALVGQDTHNRRWVDEEVHYCATSGKPVLWTQIPKTTGAAPPELRAKTPARFTPDDVRSALGAALGLARS